MNIHLQLKVIIEKEISHNEREQWPEKCVYLHQMQFVW